MPNRILKESICTSDSIDTLTWFEEVLFYRLIVNCDDYGRFDGRISVIKNRLFPLKENISAQSVEDAVERLAAVGLVSLYEVDGKPFIQLPTWENHQTVRAKKSKYPPFDSNSKALASICKQVNTSENKCSRNPIQSNPNTESESVSISNPNTTTTTNACAKPPIGFEILAYFESKAVRNADKESLLFQNYNDDHGWDCLPDWKAAADRWILRIKK